MIDELWMLHYYFRYYKQKRQSTMLNWKFKSSEKNNILVLKKITEHNNKIYTFSGISRTGIFNENILNTRIFHKQYFYKQRQPETGKNQAKAKQTPWGWTFAIWKLFAFFVQVIIQK